MYVRENVACKIFRSLHLIHTPVHVADCWTRQSKELIKNFLRSLDMIIVECRHKGNRDSELAGGNACHSVIMMMEIYEPTFFLTHSISVVCTKKGKVTSSRYHQCEFVKSSLVVDSGKRLMGHEILSGTARSSGHVELMQVEGQIKASSSVG